MGKLGWHKREHGKALNGMVGMSLELRGAYTTILDLMYDHGGPIPLNERSLCAHLDCDIRVLKRVISNLAKIEKIYLWSDGKTVFIVNEKVLSVLKIPGFKPSTSAGLTPNLSDKFAIANAELSPTFDKTPNKNNAKKTALATRAGLEKRGKKEESPLPPLKGDVDRIWAIAPQASRKRSSHADVEKALRAALGRGATVDQILSALTAYFADPTISKQNFEFAKGVHRMITEDRWRSFVETASVVAFPVQVDPVQQWRRRCAEFVRNSYWNDYDWGGKPGRNDCECPSAVLAEFNLPDAKSQPSLLFPERKAEA